jgi:hypothetical protein
MTERGFDPFWLSRHLRYIRKDSTMSPYCTIAVCMHPAGVFRMFQSLLRRPYLSIIPYFDLILLNLDQR